MSHVAVEALARERFSSWSALKEKDQQIEHMGIDSKTGLLNQQGYEFALEKREKKLEHHGRPGEKLIFTTVVIMIDLDEFKPINDTYGHAVGDIGLGAVAEAIRTQLRDDDIVAARPMGDEFIVIADIPDSKEDNQEAAENIIERLRQAMQSVTFFIGEKEMQVSGRVGGVIAQDCVGDNLTHALKQADDAMYREKEIKRTNS